MWGERENRNEKIRKSETEIVDWFPHSATLEHFLNLSHTGLSHVQVREEVVVIIKHVCARVAKGRESGKKKLAS